ncbi:hypothetical protein GE09DRAFT_721785 [Coniochaeta sp. 2T2.1]|nr:hypothetical protein GE09DRAFT_721785 [Coniochaeta sp. 2T2.1]
MTGYWFHRATLLFQMEATSSSALRVFFFSFFSSHAAFASAASSWLVAYILTQVYPFPTPLRKVLCNCYYVCISISNKQTNKNGILILRSKARCSFARCLLHATICTALWSPYDVRLSWQVVIYPSCVVSLQLPPQV